MTVFIDLTYPLQNSAKLNCSSEVTLRSKYECGAIPLKSSFFEQLKRNALKDVKVIIINTDYGRTERKYTPT